MPGLVECGEARPAGDQHPAVRLGREQRPHLCGGHGVVQDEQEAAAPHPRAVQGRAVVRIGGDRLGRYAESPQQAVVDGRGIRRAAPESVQVDEQTAVGERRLDPVRATDREFGLADAAQAGDHADTAVGLQRQPDLP